MTSIPTDQTYSDLLHRQYQRTQPGRTKPDQPPPNNQAMSFETNQMSTTLNAPEMRLFYKTFRRALHRRHGSCLSDMATSTTSRRSTFRLPSANVLPASGSRPSSFQPNHSHNFQTAYHFGYPPTGAPPASALVRLPASPNNPIYQPASLDVGPLSLTTILPVHPDALR